MDPRRPPTWDTHRAGRPFYSVERPTPDGQRMEVIRILDDDEGPRPIDISSDEDEVSAGELIPTLYSDDEDEVSEDEFGVEDDIEVQVGADDFIPLPFSDDEDEVSEDEIGVEDDREVQVGALDFIPLPSSDDEDEVSVNEYSIEDDGEVQVGAGDFIPPLFSDDEDELSMDGIIAVVDREVQVQVGANDCIPWIDSDDENASDFTAEEEDPDDDVVWSDLTSEDSGYGSLTAEDVTEDGEEDVEDEEDPPLPGVPSLELPVQPVERPKDLPPVSVRSEDSAPPASTLSSSTKRSREDSDTPQVGMKRQRKTSVDSDKEPRPSTSP
ncbi:hypothetical protein ABVT39_017719 [Epinephelus coioides]